MTTPLKAASQEKKRAGARHQTDPLPYHYDWKFTYQAELGLRVHWFGRYAGYADWVVPTSRLAADVVCFFFVERGACWGIFNGRKRVWEQGDLAMISGGDEFAFGHNPAQPHVSLSACLALQQGAVVNTLLQRKFDRCYSWREPVRYSEEFERALRTFGSTSRCRDLENAGAIFQWLAYVMAIINPPLDNSFIHEQVVVNKILAAEAWPNSRLKRSIPLAEWARAIGLNPVYFERIFTRETGMSPMKWLTQRRLQMASQYLSSTYKSVSEIADECGFANPFYFFRVFRRQFGQPPLRYRKTGFRGP